MAACTHCTSLMNMPHAECGCMHTLYDTSSMNMPHAKSRCVHTLCQPDEHATCGVRLLAHIVPARWTYHMQSAATSTRCASPMNMPHAKSRCIRTLYQPDEHATYRVRLPMHTDHKLGKCIASLFGHDARGGDIDVNDRCSRFAPHRIIPTRQHPPPPWHLLDPAASPDPAASTRPGELKGASLVGFRVSYTVGIFAEIDLRLHVEFTESHVIRSVYFTMRHPRSLTKSRVTSNDRSAKTRNRSKRCDRGHF